jgi:hypothetical protein
VSARARRWLVLAAVVAALAAAAIVTGLRRQGAAPAASATATAPAPRIGPAPVIPRARRARGEGEEAKAARAARQPQSRGPRADSPVARAERRAARAALARARRFFDAFSRYEVGQLDSARRRALAASATPAFARELLSHPPALPRRGTRPPRASVEAANFIPAHPPSARAPKRAGVAVLTLSRGARRGSASLAMLRLAEGRWRVAGLR